MSRLGKGFAFFLILTPLVILFVAIILAYADAPAWKEVIR